MINNLKFVAETVVDDGQVVREVNEEDETKRHFKL